MKRTGVFIFLLFVTNIAMSAMSETGRVDNTGVNSPTVRYYTINVNTPGNLIVQLSGLTGDADLYLYDPAGNQVDSSYAGGTTTEYCDINTSTYNSGYYSTGGYVAKVVGYADASYVITANYDKHVEVINLTAVLSQIHIGPNDHDGTWFYEEDENYFTDIIAQVDGVNYCPFNRDPNSNEYDDDDVPYDVYPNRTMINGLNTSYDNAVKISLHGWEYGGGIDGTDDLGTIVLWKTLSKKSLVNGSQSSGNNGNFNYTISFTWDDILPPAEIPSVTRNWSGLSGNGWYNLSSTNVKFTWTRVADVSGIDYYQYKIDSGSWTTTGNGGADNFVTLSGGTEGIHSLYIRAVDGEGNANTGSTYIQYGNDTIVPSVPGTPVHSDTDSGGDGIAPDPGYDDDTTLAFTWTAVGDAAKYNLYLSENGGAYTYVGNTTVNSASISGCVNGNNYRLKVTTVDQSGNESSQSSAGDSITVDTSVPPAVSSAPVHDDTDSGGDGVDPSQYWDDDTTLFFAWMSVTGADSYRVYLSENGGAFNYIGETSVNSISITGAENGNYYKIKVAAVDNAGNMSTLSSASERIDVDTVKPTKPVGSPSHDDSDSGADGVGPTEYYDDDTSLYFSWNAVADGNYYNLYLSENGSAYSYIGSTVNNSVSIGGRENGSYYSLVVTAADYAGNESDVSGTSANVTVDTTAPTTPSLNGLVSPYETNYVTVTLSGASSDAHFKNYLKWDSQNDTWTATGETTSFGFSGIADGQVTFRVRGADYAGNLSSFAEAATTVNAGAPQPITNIVVSDVTNDEGKLRIVWHKPSDQDVSAYELYRSTVFFKNISNATLIKEFLGVNLTNYIDTNVIDYQIYYYGVVAVDSGGKKNPLLFTNDNAFSVDDKAPMDVNNFRGFPLAGGNSVVLLWDVNTDDTVKYELFSSLDDTNYSLLAEIDDHLGHFTNNGLADDTWYYYRIVARDEVNNHSGTNSAQIYSGDNAPPQKPVHSDGDSGADGLVPSSGYDDDTILYFTWSAVPDVNHYNLYVSENTDGFEYVGNTVNNFISIGGCENGSSYRLKVSSVNDLGEESVLSASSASIKVDTSPPTDLQLIGLANNYSTNQIVVVMSTPSSDLNFDTYYKWNSVNGVWQSTAETTSFTFTGLPDSYIIFRIQAADKAGNVSDYDQVDTVVNAFEPCTISNYTVYDITNDQNKLMVTWEPTPDLDVTAYSLYRSLTLIKETTNAVRIARFTNTSITNYMDTNVLNDTLYYYAVVAEDWEGKKNIWAYTNGIGMSIDDKPPMSVDEFGGFSLGEGHANFVTWQTNIDDTIGYELYGSSNAVDYYLLQLLTSAESGYTNTGLAEDQWYYYKIIARDEVENASEPVYCQIYAGDITPPAPPSYIEVEPLRWGDQVAGTRIKWKTDALDSYRFRIYRNMTFFTDTNDTILLTNMIVGTNFDGDTIFSFDDVTTNHEGNYYYAVVPQDSSKHSNANHTDFTSIRGFSVDYQAPFVAIFMDDIIDINAQTTISSTLIDSHHVQVAVNLRIGTNSNWTKVYGTLVSNVNYSTSLFEVCFEPETEYLFGTECYFSANDENGNDTTTAAYKLDNNVTGTATSMETVYLKYAELFTNDFTNRLGDLIDVNGTLTEGYVTVPNTRYLDTGEYYALGLDNAQNFLASGIYREIYFQGDGTLKYAINITDLTNEMVPKVYIFNGEDWFKPSSRVITNSTNRYVEVNLFLQEEPYLLSVFYYSEYVDEPIDESTIKSYPIPAMDDMTLDFTSAMDGRVELSIYDVSGKRVFTDEDTVYAGNDNTYMFDVSGLGCGVYILSIGFYNEKSRLVKVYTKKIMVVK